MSSHLSHFGRSRHAVFGGLAAVLACVLGFGSFAMQHAARDSVRQEHATAVVTTIEKLGSPRAPEPNGQAPATADKRQVPQPQPEIPPTVAGVPQDSPDFLPVVARQRSSTLALSRPAAPLKAVVIVGPTGKETSSNLLRGEEFAALAESHGMDVRRVFHPHATWANVLANIEGANLVAYFGHGNGSPSPYGPFQERTKDGFGLDRHDGASAFDVKYYGADSIRKKVVLAANSVVVLSHLCYASGNAEPGMPIPDWSVAWQRVDNYAGGFLAVGAGAVFAYGTGSATPIVSALFTTDQTMDQIFMTRGAGHRPFYGFTGWDDRYLDSARTPGLRNHLDPGKSEGFLRAVSGDLEMTTRDWLAPATATAVRP